MKTEASVTSTSVDWSCPMTLALEIKATEVTLQTRSIFIICKYISEFFIEMSSWLSVSTHFFQPPKQFTNIQKVVRALVSYLHMKRLLTVWAIQRS